MNRLGKGYMMNWLSILFVLVVVAIAGGTALFLSKPWGSSQQGFVPYGHRPFGFSYKNTSDRNVWVYSVKVLNHTVGSGRMSACRGGSGGVGDSRKDCTPEALMATQAKFLWWEMEDPKDFNAARRGPEDPALRYRYSLPFPEFDVEADAWRCSYTLQEDNTWVGIFKGTVSKPIGAKAGPVDPNHPGVNQQWIHFNFRNLTGKRVRLDRSKTQLINPESTISPKFPAVPTNKQFHCTTAHSHEGSIFRPTPESKLQLVWYWEGSGSNKQTIALPEFSVEQNNWYCYLTLGGDQTWSAVFEGTEQEAAKPKPQSNPNDSRSFDHAAAAEL